MKPYTDLEQSKKLAEILPIDTADMYYTYVLPKSKKICHIPNIGNPKNAIEWYKAGKQPLTIEEFCVPAWSLAALLEQLPYEVVDDDGNSMYLSMNKDDDEYQLIYSDRYDEYEDIETSSYENFVDACCDMILKLHELKML